jgi:hypothetical protein
MTLRRHVSPRKVRRQSSSLALRLFSSWKNRKFLEEPKVPGRTEVSAAGVRGETHVKELVSMSFFRSALASIAVAGMVMSAQVAAQTPTESKADDAARWTAKEWKKAKASWARNNKEKWADCQKQSKDQGLTGRKGRTFLASCMTSSS